MKTHYVHNDLHGIERRMRTCNHQLDQYTWRHFDKDSMHNHQCLLHTCKQSKWQHFIIIIIHIFERKKTTTIEWVLYTKKQFLQSEIRKIHKIDPPRQFIPTKYIKNSRPRKLLTEFAKLRAIRALRALRAYVSTCLRALRAQDKIKTRYRKKFQIYWNWYAVVLE